MNFGTTWYLWLCAGLLVFALADHPYSYYQILRWVVAAGAAYTAYQAYESNYTGWTWVFAVIAILFNPIAPITMARESWQIFDVAAAALCVYYALTVKADKHA